jgi:hypothetical protein
MNPAIPSVRKVKKDELRRIFNDPKYQASIVRRTTQRVDVYEHAAPPQANQPEGTLSYVCDWMDNRTGDLLATLHQYKMPGGGLGASGLPDPVFLLVDKVGYVDP